MHMHVTVPVALRSSKTEILWMKVAWKITDFDSSCIFTSVFYELNSYKSKIVCYRAAVIGRAPMHLLCLHVNAYVVTQFRSRLDFGPARAAYNNDASVDRCIAHSSLWLRWATCKNFLRRLKVFQMIGNVTKVTLIFFLEKLDEIPGIIIFF